MHSDYIPNIDLFISMHVLKEATQANKIEGTQTSIENFNYYENSFNSVINTFLWFDILSVRVRI